MEILADMRCADMRWDYTKLTPVWEDYRDLDYTNEPFNDPVSVEKWRRQGYTQTRFTGDMYDMRRLEPAWMPILRDTLPLAHFSWSIYRMSPGTSLPRHSDTYSRFRQIHDLPSNAVIRRYVFFMEDWASGHYFEIDDEAIVGWQAGQGVYWHDDVPHIAANVGETDRYTLQITGVVNQ